MTTVTMDSDEGRQSAPNASIALSVFGILLYLVLGSWVIPMVLAGWAGVLEISKRFA